MIVAIASGKGGTGKTTVSVNLAASVGSEIQLLDCDVEEPNCHLFIKGTVQSEHGIGIPVPQVDESLCDGCGECGRFCRYSAIVAIGTKPLVFPEMCHGCGGCAKVCPKKAIADVDHRIGSIRILGSGYITLLEGRIDVGVAMAPPMIREVKQKMRKDIDTILDAPPGTSCPVIAAVRGSDFVVLVTEPTPFGLHDLQIAVDTVRQLTIPFGVVVNRMGIGDDRIQQFCREQRIPILVEIPDDRRIAEEYSKGNLIVEALPEYLGRFKSLWKQVMQSVHLAEG